MIFLFSFSFHFQIQFLSTQVYIYSYVTYNYFIYSFNFSTFLLIKGYLYIYSLLSQQFFKQFNFFFIVCFIYCIISNLNVIISLDNFHTYSIKIFFTFIFYNFFFSKLVF